MKDFPSHSNPITTIQFSVTEVYEALIDIGPKILQSAASALAHPLHHLLSISVTKHEIPAEWKIHSIVSVCKSGDKTLVSNYHPISLLCITSKVLEWLIYNQVFKHISSSISLSVWLPRIRTNSYYYTSMILFPLLIK